MHTRKIREESHQEHRKFWFHSINATKQLILQGAYWWHTIAEKTSLFITLCTKCGKKKELLIEVDLTNPSTLREIVHYKKMVENWRTFLIDYIFHDELSTGIQRKQINNT